MDAVGKKIWAIAEGYIPPDDPQKPRPFISHETVCLLNTGNIGANVKIMIYFSDKEPLGPYLVTVGGQRTLHLRFNDLNDPAPIPPGVDYSSLISSDQPIVVQYTRLDTRRADLAVFSTMAFPIS